MYLQTGTCKAFDHKQFSAHSSCYKAQSNSGKIADTEGGEGGGARETVKLSTRSIFCDSRSVPVLNPEQVLSTIESIDPCVHRHLDLSALGSIELICFRHCGSIDPWIHQPLDPSNLGSIELTPNRLCVIRDKLAGRTSGSFAVLFP